METQIFIQGATHSFDRVFLFGHYDSRGGGTLIIAKDVVHAYIKYTELTTGTEYGSTGFDAKVAQEDFLGSFKLVVVGKFDEADRAELLHNYNGKYYLGRVQLSHTKGLPNEEWYDMHTIVLIDKNHVTNKPANEEAINGITIIDSTRSKLPSNTSFRIMNWDVGEDGFGLILVKGEL